MVSGTAGYLLGRSQTGAAPQVQAEVLPNTPTPAQSQNPVPNQDQAGSFQGNQGINSFNGGFGRRGGGFGQGNNTGATNGNGVGVSNNPAQPATPANQGSAEAGNATAAASDSSASGRSLVLGSMASLAVGAALEFTTPDTNEPAFLIHEQDGSFKALSGLCTHRPYKLVYNEANKELVCNLHSVPFNIITGAPTRSPARTALSAYKVHLDGQNIVYDIS
jgi:nitrite reductase/ring-hydroxylating ferredoxin subunit